MARHDLPTGSAGRQELLYDPNLPTPSHAERARTLAGRVATGTLGTLAVEPAGFPYGSFVTFAMDAGDPVFLLSTLAEHTKNLLCDARASLLVVEPGEGDPLARGRVTLLGPCARLGAGDELDRARAAYLVAHPDAAYYLDFGDFSMFRLRVESVRYIGGYGRMSWVEGAAWHAAAPDPLWPHAVGILDHMNADHPEALLRYCHAFSRAGDATGAVMTAVDRYGFEMSVQTPAGPRPIRVAFTRPALTPEAVRAEMVALSQRARAG